MNKIQICTLLLTRKCNLHCGYCGISNKDIGPEMPLYYISNLVSRLKLHNPDMFFIIMGGEPLLRDDLPQIVQLFNEYNAHYTIISNNTKELESRRRRLFQSVEVKGYTASIDPIILADPLDLTHEERDFYKKSIEGFEALLKVRHLVKDLVGEITVTKRNVKFLYETVKMLTVNGICSDITWIDIAKTDDYDFSNVKDPNQLLQIRDVLPQISNIMMDNTLNIHMKEKLIPRIVEDLPSRMDCELEKGIHNITIDADGKLRLCLRIRGWGYMDARDCINEDGNLHIATYPELILQKKALCKGCNWTCMQMSKLITESPGETANLIHKEN